MCQYLFNICQCWSNICQDLSMYGPYLLYNSIALDLELPFLFLTMLPVLIIPLTTSGLKIRHKHTNILVCLEYSAPIEPVCSERKPGLQLPHYSAILLPLISYMQHCIHFRASSNTMAWGTCSQQSWMSWSKSDSFMWALPDRDCSLPISITMCFESSNCYKPPCWTQSYVRYWY